MLSVKPEKNLNPIDHVIIKAFEKTISLYDDSDINELWQDIKNSKFQHHDIGKGGNHIWIVRKEDKKRIALIME